MYEYQKTADQVADDIAKAYIKATDYINSEIEKIFRTFRLEGGLTESDARQLLNHIPDDVTLDSLKAVVNQIKDPVKKQKILNVINSPAYAYRIQRFEELQKDIDDKVTQLYKVEQNATKSHYIDLAEDAYYRTIFDIQKGTGLGFSFSSMSTSRVDEILKNNWSGKLFSERIWGRTKEINNAIQEELYVQFMTGRSYLKTSAEIQERMSVGAMEARRLVRTESAYISNSAELESYKECGIEEFRFIATLDMRTSELCASMDGKRFKVEDGVPGENVPPLHPWCRSTTAAVIDGEVTEGLERRARDPETGKTYLVPADMTYEEWKKSIDKKYGEGYFETERKKVLNYSSDKKQYEKYKSVLGAKNVPQSFDKFQELKYNNSEGWADIKYYARYINGRPIEYVKIDRELLKMGISDKGNAYPVEDIEVKGWRVHAENRLAKRNITKEEALDYKKNAIVMMKRYPMPETQCNYYSEKGVIGIKADNGDVCTVFSEADYRNDTIKVLEVCKKWLTM